MKNHFIIVGAQRSGTTYLYTLLDEHPEICMSEPVRPEPKYFIKKKPNEIDIKQYFQQFFSQCSSKTKATGEKTTSYYEYEESAKLISSFLPNTKIIFLLRNPIERALSNYFFSLNNNIESRSLQEVFIDNKKSPKNMIKTSVDPYDYLGRGEYAEFIKTYMKYFSKNQIKVLIFEELVNNIDCIEELYTFLEVNNSFIPKMKDEIINSSNKSNISIPHKITEYLKIYYAPFIEELELLLNRKITLWR